MDSGRKANHPTFEELMALIDGELPKSRREQLEEHIRGCEYCSAVVRGQRRMETSWREAYRNPEETELDSMRRRVMEKAHRTGRKRRLLRFGLPIAAAAIAALLGLRLFVPGAGGLLGSVDTPSTRAARRAEERIERSSDLPAAEATPPEPENAEQPAGGEEAPEEDAAESIGEALEEAQEESEPAAGIGMAQGGGGAGTGLAGAVAPEEGEEAVDATVSADADDLAGGQHAAADAVRPESSDEGLLQQPAGAGDRDGEMPEAVEATSEAQTRSESFFDQPDATEGEMRSDTNRVLSAVCTGNATDTVSGEDEASAMPDSGDYRLREALELEDAAPRAYACVAEPEAFDVSFDSAGVPSALRSSLLDSLIPEWRTGLEGLFADTTVTLRAEEIAAALDSE